MNVREKLVELLKNAKAAMKSENLSCDIARNMFVVDFMMSNGVTVQKWISVKDRLPENGVHVLLCCEIHRYDGEIAGKYVCDGYYAEANKLIAGEYEYSEEDDEYYLREGWYEVIKNWYAYTSVPVEDFVTHWMPLPEPPKGE